jgi:hypothetical protein
VYLIKTTGREEGGAAYTRAHAIVLPEHALAAPVMNLPKSLCHEIFHILSRANPDLREKLYAEIGFVKCNEVPFPKELNPRKITNPDAPKNDHCIRVQVQGKDHWGVPILFSSAAKYDREQGGEFFNYLQFQLLLVERDEAVGTVKPIYDHQEARLVGMNEVSGFFEQIGKNTGYIIHPEEVLADNFALLAMRQRQVPSPSVLEKMEAVLKGNRKTKSGAPAEAGKPGP